MDLYKDFSDLAAHQREGRDYRIIVKDVPGSDVAVVAPHGGFIDLHTSGMAQAIAADDHKLYVFEGLEPHCFDTLHITSTHFDEPRALALLAKAETTVTIHGCRGAAPVVYLSGMDKTLEKKLCDAFNKAGIRAEIEGHPYQSGTKLENICNRNHAGQGVQVEFSRGIRDSAALRDKCVNIVRAALK